MTSGFKWRLLRILPWSWMGPLVRLRTAAFFPRIVFRRNNVGAGTYIDPSVQIFGYRQVRIGRNSVISEGCWLNTNLGGATTNSIDIDNNCHVGRHNYFSAGGSIKLQDYAFTGIRCLFLGAGHDTRSPMRPYVTTGVTAGAQIRIGVNTWLTTAVTVHQGVTIGRGSIVGAGSIVRTDIPPFSIAIGNPAVVVKRFNFEVREWVNVARWSPELEAMLPSEDEYLAALRQTYPDVQPSLHSASKRFGWIP